MYSGSRNWRRCVLRIVEIVALSSKEYVIMNGVKVKEEPIDPDEEKHQINEVSSATATALIKNEVGIDDHDIANTSSNVLYHILSKPTPLPEIDSDQSSSKPTAGMKKKCHVCGSLISHHGVYCNIDRLERVSLLTRLNITGHANNQRLLKLSVFRICYRHFHPEGVMLVNGSYKIIDRRFLITENPTDDDSGELTTSFQRPIRQKHNLYENVRFQQQPIFQHQNIKESSDFDVRHGVISSDSLFRKSAPSANEDFLLQSTSTAMRVQNTIKKEVDDDDVKPSEKISANKLQLSTKKYSALPNFFETESATETPWSLARKRCHLCHELLESCHRLSVDPNERIKFLRRLKWPESDYPRLMDTHDVRVCHRHFHAEGLLRMNGKTKIVDKRWLVTETPDDGIGGFPPEDNLATRLAALQKPEKKNTEETTNKAVVGGKVVYRVINRASNIKVSSFEKLPTITKVAKATPSSVNRLQKECIEISPRPGESMNKTMKRGLEEKTSKPVVFIKKPHLPMTKASDDR